MTLTFCILGLIISGLVISSMYNYDDHKEDDDDDLIRRETLKKGKRDTID